MMPSTSSRLLGASTVLAGLFLAASPTYAVDGVVLLDPVYPISITQPGSYRLTGNLITAGRATAIRISSDDVTLDLNGFSVIGNGQAADGIAIQGANVELRNGTVRGFARHGVFALNTGCFVCVDAEGVRVIEVRSIGNGANGFAMESQGALVEKCSAHLNGHWGFYMGGDGGLVVNSVARANVSLGFQAGALNVGYRSNVFTANNGGDANPQADFGTNLGANVCGNLVCP
jgi:hypothetical protein